VNVYLLLLLLFVHRDFIELGWEEKGSPLPGDCVLPQLHKLCLFFFFLNRHRKLQKGENMRI